MFQPGMRIVLGVSAVDDYFRDLDAPSRAAFERIRELAGQEAAPLDEGTSYGMAALRYKQKPLLGFRAARGHLSIFPFSSEVVDAVSDRLAGFELSKGTIRFSVESPVPEAVVRDVVRLRVREIDGS